MTLLVPPRGPAGLAGSAGGLEPRVGTLEGQMLSVETSRAFVTDGAWEVSLDSGLSSGSAGACFLGVLAGELYLFGSAGEAAGAMKGVWRYRNGAWTQLSALGTQDFNGLGVYGASEYQGKLHAGDRRSGQLRRLDLYSNGSFNALTDAATVGGEDVFPGPVLWGKLYIGTFGNAFNEAAPFVPPGVYTYDGTTVSQVLSLTTIGISGFVLSLVPFDGGLWVSAVNEARTLCEVWAISSSGGSRLMYSGATIYRMANFNGELVAVSAAASDGVTFSVWNGDGFVAGTTLAGGHIDTMPVGPLIGVRDTLYYLDYYKGIATFSWDTAKWDYLGAFRNASGAQAAPYLGGPTSIKESDGYLWVVTNQPVKLYRKKLGVADVLRQHSRPQRASGGRSADIRPQAVATLPTASEAWRGHLLRVEAAGVVDAVYVCQKRADGTYGWQLPRLGPASASPDTISGLQLWLRPEALSSLSDGAAIATWADASGNSRDVTQATGSNRPLYRASALNGLGVADFDGVDDSLGRTAATFTGGTGWTMASVARFDALGNYPMVFSWALNELRGSAATGRPEVTGAPEGSATAPMLVTKLGYHLLLGRFNASTGGLELFVDGVLYGSVNTTADVNGGDLWIGSRGTSLFFQGRIASIAYYSRPLTDAERRGLERFLADKCALVSVLS